MLYAVKSELTYSDSDRASKTSEIFNSWLYLFYHRLPQWVSMAEQEFEPRSSEPFSMIHCTTLGIQGFAHMNTINFLQRKVFKQAKIDTQQILNQHFQILFFLPPALFSLCMAPSSIALFPQLIVRKKLNTLCSFEGYFTQWQLVAIVVDAAEGAATNNGQSQKQKWLFSLSLSLTCYHKLRQRPVGWTSIHMHMRLPALRR